MKGFVLLNVVNFWDYVMNKYNMVDDIFYGGGGGMVLKFDLIFVVVEDVFEKCSEELVVVLSKFFCIILMCL